MTDEAEQTCNCGHGRSVHVQDHCQECLHTYKRNALHEFEPLTRWQAILRDGSAKVVTGTQAELEKAKAEFERRPFQEALETELQGSQLIMSYQTYEAIIGACWRRLSDCYPPLGALIEIRLKGSTDIWQAVHVMFDKERLFRVTYTEVGNVLCYFRDVDVEVWKHAK